MAAAEVDIDDVVGSIIILSKLDRFTGKTESIHGCFATLSENPEYGDLLGDLIFSTQNLFPFSRELEQIFSDLHISRIIGMENPDFRRYQVKEKGKKFFEEQIIQKIQEDHPKEFKKIGEMAKIFKTKCAA